VASTSLRSPDDLFLLPTKAGEPKQLGKQGINHYAARWFSDGQSLLVTGNESGHGVRLYVVNVDGGKPQPITPEGVATLPYPPSPNGKVVIAIGPDHKGHLYPVSGGEPREIPGFSADDAPINWDPDGRSLYVYQQGKVPGQLFRLNIETGQRLPWKTLMPLDPAGVNIIWPLCVTPDGKSYVYGYRRYLSDLYLAEGLK
jgi:Tol biopolymer transport system component